MTDVERRATIVVPSLPDVEFVVLDVYGGDAGAVAAEFIRAIKAGEFSVTITTETTRPLP